MAISQALQPLLLFLLSLFFLPAASGAFVNFTRCFVSLADRRINVTTVEINPYPLPLGENATFRITANTTYNLTTGNIMLNTFSRPLLLNPVRKNYSLCNSTACPVTPGLFALTLPIIIPRSGNKLVNQSEYFVQIRMFESIRNENMCVVVHYPIINWT